MGSLINKTKNMFKYVLYEKRTFEALRIITVYKKSLRLKMKIVHILVFKIGEAFVSSTSKGLGVSAYIWNTKTIQTYSVFKIIVVDSYYSFLDVYNQSRRILHYYIIFS